MFLYQTNSTGNEELTRNVLIQYEVEERDEYISIECPECGGNGEVASYSYETDRTHDIECPLCSGTGEYETYIYIDSETIEDFIEDSVYSTPYQENGLSYRGNSCTHDMTHRSEEQLYDLMSQRLETLKKEKEKENENEKIKILEKIKSLDFSKLETLDSDKLERIAELME